MVNRITSSSDLASKSLLPLDGDGLKKEELAKRFPELQSAIKWLKEENAMLAARDLVMEERCKSQLRSPKDKEEMIIHLGVRNRQLEVEMEKMVIDLQAARRDCGGEIEVVRLKRLLEVKNAEITELKQKNEVLETAMGDRVIKLEESVEKWLGMEDTGCKSFKDSGEKTVNKSIIEPKESIEKEIDAGNDKNLKVPETGKEVSFAQKSADPFVVEISDDEEEEESYCDELKTKMASSEDSGGATGQPMTMAINGLIHDGTKIAPSVSSPSTANGHENLAVPQKRKSEAVASSTERQSETKRSKCDDSKDGKSWETLEEMKSAFGHENLAVPQKRKSEAVVSSTERQSETKQSKCDGSKDGKSLETLEKMKSAFITDVELCMKSVCALYRKHKSLGVWKYHKDGSRVLKHGLEISVVQIGELLTGGDPEGRMKKSLADLERRFPRGAELCRMICKYQGDELFKIYSSNLDPLFRA